MFGVSWRDPAEATPTPPHERTDVLRGRLRLDDPHALRLHPRGDGLRHRIARARAETDDDTAGLGADRHRSGPHGVVLRGAGRRYRGQAQQRPQPNSNTTHSRSLPIERRFCAAVDRTRIVTSPEAAIGKPKRQIANWFRLRYGQAYGRRHAPASRRRAATTASPNREAVALHGQIRPCGPVGIGAAAEGANG